MMLSIDDYALYLADSPRTTGPHDSQRFRIFIMRINNPSNPAHPPVYAVVIRNCGCGGYAYKNARGREIIEKPSELHKLQSFRASSRRGNGRRRSVFRYNKDLPLAFLYCVSGARQGYDSVRAGGGGGEQRKLFGVGVGFRGRHRRRDRRDCGAPRVGRAMMRRRNFNPASGPARDMSSPPPPTHPASTASLPAPHPCRCPPSLITAEIV